ncbi:MAG: hypothetical protein M1838_001743 [Thelocarpon superellum]|nr:MAG: hypothetical protein M1838_001743 [Thelocarpon superellum]
MPTLNLILTPEAVGRIHDVLVCLGKFNESVSIEARKDKALLSVFKGRLLDARDRDTAIERCELSIQDRPGVAECRLLVKMMCRHGTANCGIKKTLVRLHQLNMPTGVIKTYKLTYESTEVMHALFDRETAANRWKVSSRMLKEFTEHFGPKTEQLDIYSENGRVTFTSYTEKIMDGKELLKQPLQTSVAVDSLEFEEFVVEEKLHIAISVKDFKAIVYHGDTINATVAALYSSPTKPMQISYEGDGMLCEYTLMTIGDFRGGSAPTAQIASKTISKPTNSAPVPPEESTESRPVPTQMPPPERPAVRSFRSARGSQREKRPIPAPPKASLDNRSLFFPEGDDDRRWDENGSDEADEDVLGWDPSADTNLRSRSVFSKDRSPVVEERARPPGTGDDASDQRIAPTQRISEVRGIFDD